MARGQKAESGERVQYELEMGGLKELSSRPGDTMQNLRYHGASSTAPKKRDSNGKTSLLSFFLGTMVQSIYHKPGVKCYMCDLI